MLSKLCTLGCRVHENHPIKIWCRESLSPDSSLTYLKTALGSVPCGLENALQSQPHCPYALVTGPPKCRREASTSTNLRFIPSGLQLHGNFTEVFCFSFEHKACKCCILFHDLLIFKNKNNVLNHFHQGERNSLLKAWICLPNTSIRKGKATREELQFHKGELPPLVLRTTLPESGGGGDHLLENIW